MRPFSFHSSFFYIILGVLSSSIAQAFLKYASLHGNNTFLKYIVILMSICFYCFSFFLYYIILKKVPISIASPVMTSGVIIVVVIIGTFFFGEKVSIKNIIGIILSIISIYLISS